MNREMLTLVDVLAREKSVPKEIVFQALENALAQATKRQHSDKIDARVAINRETGEYEAFRRWAIVTNDEFVEPDNQMMLHEAHEVNPALELGGFVEEPLQAPEFGRIGAQAAKQAILQRIRDAEREQMLEEFLARNDTLVSGTVRRLDRGNVIVEAGRIEGVIPRDQMIPKESLRPGDRVRAYLSKIDRTARGPQLILSRISPEFIKRLFELEVPEIEEGLIEMRAAARDPGMRAKVAVKSNDRRIDPQGTCIGMRGARVNAVTNELAGERVDVILFSDDPAQFVINALAPAQISRIMVDEDKHAMDVVVDEENLAIAIGRGGQNVRLASELTGWKLNLMSSEESEKKQQDEAQRVIAVFMDKLDVDEEVAQILVEEGFNTLEEIAYVPVADLQAIEGFDQETVEELRNRARNAVLTAEIAREESLDKVKDDLKSMEGIDATLLATLASKGVFSRDDLGDLATDELVEMTGLSNDAANALIMKAREHWFAENSN
jgi:transcription termination/antitermination protein NusA